MQKFLLRVRGRQRTIRGCGGQQLLPLRWAAAWQLSRATRCTSSGKRQLQLGGLLLLALCLWQRPSPSFLTFLSLLFRLLGRL